MTVTKKRVKPGGIQELERVQAELEATKANLDQVNLFLEKIQNFSEVVTHAKDSLRDLFQRRSTLKDELTEINTEIRSLENLIDSSNDAMISVLEPGPAEFLPLFDKMEKANPKTHGRNAQLWRERPISVLRLSPIASQALIDAGVVFIGQLQDRVLEDPDQWWESIEGLDEVKAAAIADKLNDFVSKGGV